MLWGPTVKVPKPPYISHFGDVWGKYGAYGRRRTDMPNMVTVRRHVPVEGSNQKLVVLTHPNHFTIGVLSVKLHHRHSANMYGKPIQCKVHARTVTGHIVIPHIVMSSACPSVSRPEPHPAPKDAILRRRKGAHGPLDGRGRGRGVPRARLGALGFSRNCISPGGKF